MCEFILVACCAWQCLASAVVQLKNAYLEFEHNTIWCLKKEISLIVVLLHYINEHSTPNFHLFAEKLASFFFTFQKLCSRGERMRDKIKLYLIATDLHFFLNQSGAKRWKNTEARIRRLQKAAHSVRKVFRAGKFLRGAWWKNHVMPIAATVTLTLPARFLCRTAQKKWEAQKATAC